MYNGKDRQHMMKFQGVTTPDHLIVQLRGPFAGNRHDSKILAKSSLIEAVRAATPVDTVDALKLFADSGYPNSDIIRVMLKNTAGNPERSAYNLSMSKLRIAAEWSFGRILQYWATLGFPPVQKFVSSRVDWWYLTATLLTNCHTCMYRQDVSICYFGVLPPSLHDYLHSVPFAAPPGLGVRLSPPPRMEAAV
jgi:hypothetical protein